MRLLLACSFILLLIVGSTFFGCDILDDNDKEEPAPFSMQVIPTQMEITIPGQRCVFLVSVADEGKENKEGKVVKISASAPGAAVSVEPQMITPGQVAEVTLIPDETMRPDKDSEYKTIEGTIFGERDNLKQTEKITVKVLDRRDMIAQSAVEMRDKFIPWLADNHPEFGITSETEWIETIVLPGQYIISYYLFFSEDWEMGVDWHVTRPPDNWTRIYLRQRFTEMYPSYGFEISSWSTEGEEPHIIDPKDPIYNMSDVWR